MTLSEFVEKYKGKPVDFDGAYGAQCVDLARQYFREVWELPKQPEGVVGAKDFYFLHNWRPIQKEFCECTECPFGGVPPVGSVVIFNASPTNQYGHIGICVEADKNRMMVFEQNGIENEKALKEGRPQKGAYIGTWSYDRLAGWLTKKETALGNVS
jgi:hypothetical protein